MNQSNAPLIAGLVVVAGLGAAHGVATDRWQPSGALVAAADRLDRFPMAFGDWVGTDQPYAADDMARSGVTRCVHRRYHNARSRATVSVLLVCGRGGPICAHTPDVCYTGAGYQLASDPQSRDIPGDDGPNTFQVARFGKPGAVVPTQLEIFWAWSRDGQSWAAPANPRLTFARYPMMYKFYVVREFSQTARAAAGDPCQEFLHRALPDIRETLGPARL